MFFIALCFCLFSSSLCYLFRYVLMHLSVLVISLLLSGFLHVFRAFVISFFLAFSSEFIISLFRYFFMVLVMYLLRPFVRPSVRSYCMYVFLYVVFH